MRWIGNTLYDVRIAKRFLLFPLKPMRERETRWLEMVYIHEEWLIGWCAIHWSTKERYDYYSKEGEE